MKLKKHIGTMLGLVLMLLGMSMTAWAENYPLSVGGVNVTSDNNEDILKGTANQGKVSFTPALGGNPATLILKGVKIIATDTNRTGIYYYGDDPLNIVMQSGSENIINGMYFGINCGIETRPNPNAVITFSGSGVLNISSDSEYGCGIRAIDGANFNSGTVEVSGKYGIYGNSGVKISGGVVTARGISQAIFAQLTVDDGLTVMAGDVAPGTDATSSFEQIHNQKWAKIGKYVTRTVTFNVMNGDWNNGNKNSISKSITGFEDETKLATDQIPAVGSKPDSGYKEGGWDVTPKAGTLLTENKTYTYTYAKKDTISATVTFKVENGSWDDGNTKNKTVELSGSEGDTLKLSSDQIPSVGTKPNNGYKKGTWDKTPSTNTAITANTTYTYKYAKNEDVKKDPTPEPTPELTPEPTSGPDPKPTPKPTPKENAGIALNAGLKLSWSGSKITLVYGAVKGATGYDIYATYCGTKNYKKIATEKGCSTTIKKLNGKKLKKKSDVKFYVVAKNGDKVLAKSLLVHVAGPKNKYTYAKKIKISKKSYTLIKGNTVKLKPRLVRKNKKKKRLPNYHAPKFRYATSDKSVATVSKNGKVKAVGKGTCDVYIYAVNGMTQKVKVAVK